MVKKSGGDKKGTINEEQFEIIHFPFPTHPIVLYNWVLVDYKIEAFIHSFIFYRCFSSGTCPLCQGQVRIQPRTSHRFIAGMFLDCGRQPEKKDLEQSKVHLERPLEKLHVTWHKSFVTVFVAPDFYFYFETLPIVSMQACSSFAVPAILMSYSHPDCIHLFPITLCLDSLHQPFTCTRLSCYHNREPELCPELFPLWSQYSVYDFWVMFCF